LGADMKYLAIRLGIQAANALLEIDTTHPNPGAL